MSNSFKPATLCVQGGWQPKKGEPRVLPIYQSTTFKYETSEQMAKLFDLEESGYFYTRLQNPTNDAVASKIAALEGGVAAMLTSSGQAANFFACFNICEAGDHIVSATGIYGGTYNLLSVTLKKLGINMVTSTYPKSWTVSYETGDIEGMARAYSANVYPNRNLNYDVANMVNLAKKFDLDGIIFHSNRSCKLMDFRQYEVQRRVLEECGVPSVIFDGDQTDPRLFSEAQYETRIQALAEMMAENKAKKGRAAQ